MSWLEETLDAGIAEIMKEREQKEAQRTGKKSCRFH